MNYKIVFEKPAQKFLLKQPANVQKRLLSAIAKLPTSGDIKQLHGHDCLYRLRIGDFREYIHRKTIF